MQHRAPPLSAFDGFAVLLSQASCFEVFLTMYWAPANTFICFHHCGFIKWYSFAEEYKCICTEKAALTKSTRSAGFAGQLLIPAEARVTSTEVGCL